MHKSATRLSASKPAGTTTLCCSSPRPFHVVETFKRGGLRRMRAAELRVSSAECGAMGLGQNGAVRGG